MKTLFNIHYRIKGVVLLFLANIFITPLKAQFYEYPNQNLRMIDAQNGSLSTTLKDSSGASQINPERTYNSSYFILINSSSDNNILIKKLMLEGNVDYGAGNNLDNTDFDSLELYMTKQISYRLINSSDSDVTINAIDLGGSDKSEFNLSSVISFPAVMQAGDSLLFEIAFEPVSEGRKEAKISIDLDDEMYSDYTFTLTGTGYQRVSGFNNPFVKGLNVYPNPASNNWFISVPQGMDNIKVCFYNNLGQDLLKFDVPTSGVHQIDLSNLESGIYTVKLASNGVVSNYKLVVRR